jgi:hypothetical protein
MVETGLEMTDIVTNELRSFLCEGRLERTVLSSVLLPIKTAQFTQFFRSGMSSNGKIAQFN